MQRIHIARDKIKIRRTGAERQKSLKSSKTSMPSCYTSRMSVALCSTSCPSEVRRQHLPQTPPKCSPECSKVISRSGHIQLRIPPLIRIPPPYSEHLENKGVLLLFSHVVLPLTRAAGARKIWGPEVSDKNPPPYSEQPENKGGGVFLTGSVLIRGTQANLLGRRSRHKHSYPVAEGYNTTMNLCSVKTFSNTLVLLVDCAPSCDC